MNRMLTGDVGSGKTVVALSAALLAIENNHQAAVLAPTEILATQHAISISKMLEGLPVKIALVTGKLSFNSQRRTAMRKAIAEGEAQLVIGTHALLESDVKFKDMALVIIDEQHRFGVLQRAELQNKADTPDVLVMTATPIPRSLALTLYGDLDVSVIGSLPPGRIPIITRHVKSEEAYNFVKSEVDKKHQAYIVYPLVEESDSSAMKAAVSEAANLSATVFSGLRVALLHGQMKAADKDAVMSGFRDGVFDILIATTVIEVGIDVPNATVMVIEHSERFGLATLHQLRGRVGRGSCQSYCLLLGEPPNPQASRRIEVMLSTTDGFKIAEEDLALRGPGEFFGTAQHGLPELKAGNIITDLELVKQAKEVATQIIAVDPALNLPENHPLRQELLRQFGNHLILPTL
jgi:ATP-dependent DNA helicase RecG